MRYNTITASAVAAILSFANVVVAVTGQLGDAPIINDNPNRVKYQADLTNTSTVNGIISFQGRENGTGITVNVSLTNFPAEGGPFLYHVHQHRIEDGNCTTALAHLDPYLRGEKPPCDPTMPQTCQVGDLSGKHGKIPATYEGSKEYFNTQYIEDYASTFDGVDAFVGNLSVVIHLNDTTRIACANINLVTSDTGPGTTPTNGTTTNGTVTPTYSVTPTQTFENAGNGVKFGGLLMALSVVFVGAVLV